MRQRIRYTAIIHVFLLILVAVVKVEAAFHSNGAQRYRLATFAARRSPSLSRRRCSHHCVTKHKVSPLLLSLDDRNGDPPPSTSLNFALDPDSDEAKRITSQLGISSEQHDKLAYLARLVVEYNQYINLVSRRDCNVEVVFGRHVLPSIALLHQSSDWQNKQVIDVGTGGGFPGLPLAILLPETQFMLVDSVGKKVRVVEEMAAELELDNVQVSHGRAEEMVDNDSQYNGLYDICVGRSVAALPKFCFWIQELIKPESGRLFYVIGGDLEPDLLAKADSDVAIDDVLEQQGASDKRILTFSQEAVASIAASSGEVKRKRGKPKQRVVRTSKKAKGQWKKRDATKQRGYDEFKRFSTD